MNMYIFWGTIAGMAMASLAPGLMKKTKTNTLEDYFVCKSSLKLGWLTLTILATQLGGGALIGAAETAYTSGWMGCFYSLGISLGLIAMAVFVAPKLKKYKLMTMSAVFGEVYKSPTLKTLSAVISVITLFFILVAIGVSCRKLFTSFGYDSVWVLAGFWAVILGYTTFGGLRAVVITDALQVLFIIMVFGCISVWVLQDTNITQAILAYTPQTGTEISWMDWVLMPLCFMLISQDMGQRCFAAANQKTVQKGLCIAAVLLIILSAVPVGLGILAAQLNISSGSESILMGVASHVFSPAMASLIAISIIVAIVSTADSLLCAISSNISLDIMKNSSVKQSKIITFLIGLAAMQVSLTKSDIIPIMLVGYEVSVFVLFVPFIMGLYKKKVSKKQAAYSMGIGFICFAIKKLYAPLMIEFVMLVGCILPYMFLKVRTKPVSLNEI